MAAEKSLAGRRYRDSSDIAVMKRVAGQAFRDVPANPLPGLEWVVFGPHGFAPHNIIRIWEDESGNAFGWGLLASAERVEYRVLPSVRGSALEEAILDWGIRSIEAWRRASGVDPRCVVECWDGDSTRLALLKHLGFASSDHLGVVLTRALDDDPRQIERIEGWTVRGVRDPDIDDRAETQREAFAPGSKTTPATWRYLMTAPGYERDLDNIAVDADGRVGAAALVWLDHDTKIGEFEPVGTRPQFRRRGLGLAVLRRGLAKMRDRGMNTAMVGTNGDNAPAIALYRSAGFDVVNRSVDYQLT